MDVNKMADAVFEQVSSYVNKATGPLLERIASLETIISGLPSAPSIDALQAALTPALLDQVKEISAQTADEARKAIESEAARVKAEEIDPLVERMASVESGVANLPSPPTVDDLSPSLLPPLVEQMKEAVQKAVAEIPKPKDGEDGECVTVEDIHPVMMLEISKWALDFERRAGDVLQRAVERAPVAKDGKDGLGWDDMRVEYDGERTVTLVYEKGDDEFTFPVTFPVVLDRGFWKDGFTAEKGDGLTFGGSYWIAQSDTQSKPEIDNPDWRLAVKKGRDGRKDR